MHPAEIEACLSTLTLLVDTREQETAQFRRRLASAGLPWERHKLQSGDYSARVTLPDGDPFTIENNVVIERKMSLDELAMCFGSQRDRFTREFERFNGRIYLLTEGGSFEKILKHQYKSKLSEKALFASLLAFSARYNATPIFCGKDYTGTIIKEILLREMKEALKGADDGNER